MFKNLVDIYKSEAEFLNSNGFFKDTYIHQTSQMHVESLYEDRELNIESNLIQDNTHDTKYTIDETLLIDQNERTCK